MNFTQALSHFFIGNTLEHRHEKQADIQQVAKEYDFLSQASLGTFENEKTNKRTPKSIYTLWQIMQTDPQIAEALSLHVTAALGGHERTGDVIFISPHERIRGNGLRAKELRTKIQREAKHITPLLNRYAFSLARQAIAYGDSYARIYSLPGKGVIDLLNNEYTIAPMIQPFEQGGKNIGFIVLEANNWEKVVTRLTPLQLLRVKMQRIEHVPQIPLNVLQSNKQLEFDIQADLPILPSPVGGSFLYPVEKVWQDVVLNSTALVNQQIADSVKQSFLAINMDGMPESQRKKYINGLKNTISNYLDNIKKAFAGGEALYGTKYHILPTWGDKQTIQPIGDLSQRQSPLNSEALMISLRRLAGGLGLDLSLIGWADMLAGGLGDGASFHTSAQIMRRSTLIRQSLIDAFNHLMTIHWGLKYDEYFQDGEYPWQFDFYSDQSAAATEALTNKQTRMNTLIITAQGLTTLRDLGLDSNTNASLLETIGGFDHELAVNLSENLKPQQHDENNVADSENVDDENIDEEME